MLNIELMISLGCVIRRNTKTRQNPLFFVLTEPEGSYFLIDDHRD